jgi:murein DD-endopeptidase MepM/ murein hydrolase activator NlpD
MMQPPFGKPWLLYALLGSSLAMNVYMVLERPSVPEGAALMGVATPASDVVVTPPTIQTAGAGLAPSPIRDLADAIVKTGAAPAPTMAVDPGEWELVDAVVEHSLARTFQHALGEKGNAVSAVVTRLFVWDMDMRRELRSGDRVAAAYKILDDGEIVVGAALLKSQKQGRTLTSFRWTAPGDAHPSYWRDDGTGAAKRLIAGPLRDYVQVTSLLADRPQHRGMDFKTPVGTPVHASFPGRVTRTNWNTGANGGCVEVEFQDGTLAKYLHLSEVKVKPGQSVSAGAVLASTGNSGRSTAPHLHYELAKGNKVVDPIDYHGTSRRKVSAKHQARFDALVDSRATLLDGRLASM